MNYLPTFWLEDVECVRFDVEPSMAWVKLLNGKQFRLTLSEHSKLIETGKVLL